MPLDQEQIIAVASVVKKLKDDNINISNNLTPPPAPPAKLKAKAKLQERARVRNILVNCLSMAREKNIERIKTQRTGKQKPRKSITRITSGSPCSPDLDYSSLRRIKTEYRTSSVHSSVPSAVT